jgi:outer membrane autotransporter protein
VTSINGTTNGSIVATGAATATAGYGLTLNVSNYIPNNTTYTIIDGTGGTGIAAPTITVVGDNHATFTATTVGEDLVLTASRGTNGFASDTSNSNGAAVGNVLDNITNPTGDMATVLNTLEGQGNAQVGNALGTMTPDVSSGTAESSRGLTINSLTMVANRLGGVRDSGALGSGVSSGDMTDGMGVWIQGLGSNMSQGERKGVEGYSANLFGTTIGADKVINDHFRAGFAGGYGWAGVRSKQPGSPSDNINSYQGTIYGSYDSLNLNKARQGGKKSYEAVRTQVEDSWYVDGMAAFTQNNYDSRREIWLTPTTQRVAKADHYGQQYSTNFETGYKFVFEKTKALEVTPFTSLGYNYLYMNKYKEKGADTLNLSVNGEGFHRLEQRLGGKLAYPIVAKKVGTFIPSAKAAWMYDYIGDRFETDASFAGGGGSFTTKGAKPAKNGMIFGAELAFLNKGNVTVTGNWDIEAKDQFASNTYYGTVRYDF